MKAKKIALFGILGALAITVSFIDGLFALPFLPPGAKIGLSNVITLFALNVLNLWGGIYVVTVKAVFALLTRGVSAFLLSFSGGLLSFLVMAVLLKMKKCPFSIIGISIIGAIIHNIAQLGVSMFLTGTPALIYYLPVLVVFSLFSGTVTGVIIKILKPYIQRIREQDL
ncbi:MAG: Gx transporter family protein [Clostridiales bacterium]|nr:Gx transporter family protein [Clostridiales bacterium]